MKVGIGAGLIGAVAVLIWLGTGFIVQEGQQAVITQFGNTSSTVGVGFTGVCPIRIRHEVAGTDDQSMWGRDTASSRLPGLHQVMLTGRLSRDQICGAHRLSDARAHLFERSSVVVSGETAVRRSGWQDEDGFAGAGRGT
jgi:membrane protease subunit HflK